jgi:pyroglutamyl-peptidase
MYGLLHYLEKEKRPIKGGFIHLPFFTEQVLDKHKTPSLTLDQITRGVVLALETLAQ